ncbi:MAG TPA: ABC transporter substrate-binding protein, partial [Thermoplasmata archaeon]|nr:ABC transporter substrate-binding protein [Thermoplasmata archaeon]
MGRKKTVFAMWAFISMVLLAGMSSLIPSSVMAADPVTLRIGILQAPDNLNPFDMKLSISYTVSFLMYDTLNSIEPNFSAGPQLAETWYHDDTDKVWYYNITHDATWHDGVPLTAHDVNFTYNLVKDNEKQCSLWIDYLSNFTDIRALSDYQLRITTDVPKATMLSIMVPVLPKHIWEDIPVKDLSSVDYWKDDNYFPDGPIGSGPLILDEFVLDDFVRMLKNDDYFIDTVNFDILLYKVFASPDLLSNSLKSGFIDIAEGISSFGWNTTIEAPNVDGQEVPTLSLYELGINCASEEWREAFPKSSDNLETTNLAVRQVIAMMTNKSDIVTECKSGLAFEGSGLIPPATPYWHYEVPVEEAWDYGSHEDRVEAANDMLENAGYKYISSSDVRENETNGVLLDFVFNYRLGHPDEEMTAQKIEAWLSDIGIKAEPIGLQEAQLTNAWFACSYDLYIWGWDADVDPSFMLSVMTTGQIPESPQDFAKWSDCFYSNPTYDQLYLDQQNAVDPEDRQAIILEMQEILYYDCPYVVLWYPQGLYAYRTDTFYNYPDMAANPGSTPGTMWFFFEILPYSDDMNLPPEDVYAGPDQEIEVGGELTFTGYAEDPNTGDVLTYTWTFTEPDSSETVRVGQTVDYTFEYVGAVDVELEVEDSGGLSDSDSLVVTVTEEIADAGWAQGYVVDSDGHPIAGATIMYIGKTRTVNSEGAYNISLSPGIYMLNATADGYTTQSENITIETDVISWTNFTLTSTIGSLMGRVVDADTGLAIDGASVKVTIGTFSKMALTN